MGRYDLSEIEWRVIEPLLPNRYGPYTTVHNRYNRRAKAGVRLRIFEALAATSPHRSPLRQTRQKLPGRRPHRINQIVAQSL